jgi:hypothetical protein
MNRDRAELRKNRLKKIKQRIRTLINMWGSGYPLLEPGKYENNNYVNMGGYIKTNVRKAHSNYRRPGGFGKDKNWCRHDQRQIDDMDLQEKDLDE